MHKYTKFLMKPLKFLENKLESYNHRAQLKDPSLYSIHCILRRNFVTAKLFTINKRILKIQK